MSTRLMIALMVAYVVIAIAAAIEGKRWLALYFVGAIVLTAALVGMSWDE